MKKADGPGKAISERKAVGEQELAEQAARKRLMEMNLLDDFLFGSIVSYLVMVYTVKTSVWKNREWSMRMGRYVVFVYKRKNGGPNESLKQLLHYMEENTSANAVNNDLKVVHRMVEVVK